ncbi:MAG: DUF695 domain-containing protein [Crocinitomicaceae bacterium]|nr:DUF695 domain-containing protein [Crocinitomicaceae bacterium]
MGLFNFKKKKTVEQSTKGNFKVKRENWGFYTMNYDNGTSALVEFDYDHAVEESHDGYNSCIRVIIHMKAKNVLPTGLPKKEENARVEQMAVGMLNTLSSVDCRLVVKSLYGAMFDYCFQTNDPALFLSKINDWITSQKNHKVELIKSKGWDFYDERLRPNARHWQQISDRSVVLRMMNAGSNPEKDHILEHTFIGDDAKLKELSLNLENGGFTVQSTSEGCLVMTKSSKLIVPLISPLTGKLAGFAESMGVKYDGWGAMIVK